MVGFHVPHMIVIRTGLYYTTVWRDVHTSDQQWSSLY